jgi:hypothetical protein
VEKTTEEDETDVKWHVVRASVSGASRARYLKAWSEWSGTLFAMGIETELLEAEERPGSFVEITRFEAGREAALGDDRVVGIQADLEAASMERVGDLALLREVEEPAR